MPLTKVTSGAITDSAITTAKIEDGTIVNADISASANIAQSKLSLSLPTISSISIQNSQGAIPPSDTSLYFDIIGTNFSNPSTVELLNSSTNASTNATTVTYVSATQLRVTASLSAGTYKIRVTRSDGFAGISATALLTVSQAVSWSTSAGSLGTFDEGVAISTITLSATSNSAITYAIQSGSLPTGLSLNTSNGEITGTPSSVAADTTSTFTVRATDAESQFADREFNITVTDIVIFQSLRFNDNDNPYLNKTMATGTSRRIFTFSTWVKRSALGSFQYIFTNSPQSSFDAVRFNNDDSLDVRFNANTYTVNTNRLYRDVSAWYHILVSVDTTQATDSDRVKIYTNGVLETSLQGNTYPTQDYDTAFGVSGQTYQVSANTWGIDQPFDGYMAEVHFIDGQALTPSSFGTTGSNGRWKPKTYSGTYGTNGFYLDFADSGNLGDDESGNTNDFTANNLAAIDQVTDTPQNNFATMIPAANLTISEGNLNFTHNRTSNWDGTTASMGVQTGKWYYEAKLTSTDSNPRHDIGFVGNPETWTVVVDGKGTAGDPISNMTNAYWFHSNTNSAGYLNTTGTYGSNVSQWGIASGDIVGVALDLDNQKIYFHKNGTYYGADGNSSNPTNGTNPAYSSITTGIHYRPFLMVRNDGSANNTISMNFGNPSFTISSGNSDDNGYGNFEYAPPSGYLALCTNNLPEPTIKDSSDYFNTVLYTGDGNDDRTVTGVGFQPDFLWIKERSSTSSHRIFDSSRGASKRIEPDNTNAESTDTTNHKSFDADGFTLGTSGSTNENSQTYVAWNWKANVGSTSSNTDGSITSTVQANTTAGFSIVTYTGTGSNATIGHGLGKAPSFLVTKARNTAGYAWIAWHNALTGDESIELQSTDAKSTNSTSWNSTVPTSSVFSVGTRLGTNANGTTYVAYCFAEIEGYSKFGKYTGNGSTNGTFVYTGFKPAWLMVKRTDSAGENWTMFDNKRDGYNVNNDMLKANVSETEDAAGNFFDLLSNGFKVREIAARHNASGGTYIYMAFAEAPFGGILTNEATAR